MESSEIPSASEMFDKVNGNFLVIPYPIQGHINPMMKLSELIATHGSKVTLVVTEHTYKVLYNKHNDQTGERQSAVNIVAVSDGLDPEDDRKDGMKVAQSIMRVMPGNIRTLIAKASQQAGNNSPFTCLIATTIFPWVTEIAEKNGMKLAWFWPSSPGALASALQIPQIIQSGFIDQEGTLMKKEELQLLPGMPDIDIGELPWMHAHQTCPSKRMFQMFCATEQVTKQASWVLCNWFSELCPSASVSIPNVVPVGPLLENLTHTSGTPNPEDSACFTWLDQQPSNSVIYVAFGSLSMLSQKQLDELASGLELSGRRFLWVARAGLTEDSHQVKFPDGFEERIAGFGMIVKWSSQEKVLAHPSIACFLTHCGWNSTMEGLSNGVPLLCWPCFSDQLYTRTCICHAWKIGVSLVPEKNSGIILASEVKEKISEVLSRADLKENSLKLKEMAQKTVAEGGSSFTVMQNFIRQTLS